MRPTATNMKMKRVEIERRFERIPRDVKKAITAVAAIIDAVAFTGVPVQEIKHVQILALCSKSI